MLNQDGLEWKSTTFGLEPRWTKEPNVDIIARIARKHLDQDEDSLIEVLFYSQGAFNKLYKISGTGPDVLLRVSLPVDPGRKTESEVATINFIHANTDIPVPRIIAFDSDTENELGFEWILMELMPGGPVRRFWRKMSWDAKEKLVGQLAKHQAQLFAIRFQQIGNIVPLSHRSKATSEACSEIHGSYGLSCLVSMVYFWGDHHLYGVSRGPFKNSYEWLQSRLELALKDQDRILRTSDDEDDIEDAEFARDLAERISQILPDIFKPESKTSESNVLFHDDLSMQNILVDQDGTLSAVVDWECVSAVPLWRACQFPHLLEGRKRHKKPEKNSYMKESEDEARASISSDTPDNEGVNVLYWEHLLEYEKTQLRQLFLEEMERLSPEWVAEMSTSMLKVDFEKAVHNCDNTWSFKVVKRWLDAYMVGNVGSLSAQLIA